MSGCPGRTATEERRKGEAMYIYHMTNSGLLISTNGVKFLVDGIFSRNNLFNPLDAELENGIMDSVGPFAGIDCLLFTHCHEDHYDGTKVKKYLEDNPNTALILPEDAVFGRELRDYYRQEERICLLDSQLEYQVFDVKNTTVHLFRTKHLDYASAECDVHYSIIIDDGNNRVGIAGDIELNDEETKKVFSGKRFDAVFLNPVVLYRKSWIDNFKSIDAEKKYIYHIPAEDHDRLLYRKMTLYHYSMMKNKLVNCELLLNKMQKITLKRTKKSA